MTGRERLLAAYCATTYRVAEVALRIGQVSPALDRLLAREGARCGCFVTAWNPRSELLPEVVNRAAGARLAAEVARLGRRALHAVAAPDGADWPAEEGLFVLDLAEAAALSLAERHGQNAILQAARGTPPRLVPTRLMG